MDYSEALNSKDFCKFQRVFPDSNIVKSDNFSLFCMNKNIIKNIEIDGIDLGNVEKIGNSDLSWGDDQYNETIDLQGIRPYFINNREKGNRFELHFMYPLFDIQEFLLLELDNVTRDTYLNIKTLKFSHRKYSKFYIPIEYRDCKDFMEETFLDGYREFRRRYYLSESDVRMEVKRKYPEELSGLSFPEKSYKEMELNILLWDLEHIGKAKTSLESSYEIRRIVKGLGYNPRNIFKFSYVP